MMLSLQFVLMLWSVQAMELQQFSEIKTLRCELTETEGRRIDPKGDSSMAKRETFSDLVIDNVNYRASTARFIGNAGSETVTVMNGERLVTFLETTMSG